MQSNQIMYVNSPNQSHHHNGNHVALNDRDLPNLAVGQCSPGGRQPNHYPIACGDGYYVYGTLLFKTGVVPGMKQHSTATITPPLLSPSQNEEPN